MASLEVMYKFNIFPGIGLGVTAGPTFDYALKKSYTQTLELEGPLEVQFVKLDPNDPVHPEYKNYVYDTDLRGITIKQGDIEDSKKFRLGLKFGLQYEFNFTLVYVVPSIYYNLGVNKLSDALNWRVNVFQAGVDVRFAIPTNLGIFK